jgi:hypothetical protein
MTEQTYETFLEKEEFITAEEYLRRRALGEIASENVRIVSPDIKTGSLGGFLVKLETPRYRVQLEPAKNRGRYVW